MKLKPFVAEFLATFLFVFIGVGSVAAAGVQGSTLGQIGPALAHGLALAVLISAIASISGGQVNPAVTLAVWLGNQITFLQAVLNIIGQVFGSFLAIHALLYCLGPDRLDAVMYGTPAPAAGIGQYQAMMIEGIATFILALVVFGTMVDRRSPKINGLYVGLSLTAAALAIGPFTGACLNPARYLGPAIQGAGYQDLMIYTAGPILGAAIAALIYTYGIGREEKLDLPGETP
jgi:MIP family channel proteins